MAYNGQPCDETKANPALDQPDLGDYQRAWDEELGGNPTWVFVGIGIALLLFASIGVLPWTLSYLQDNGIIKPRIHLRHHIDNQNLNDSGQFRQRNSMTTFGSPRQP